MLLATALALPGCAKAVTAEIGENVSPDAAALPGTPDAAALADAAAPDAAVVPVTLSHSATSAIDDQQSLRCNDNENNTHTANSYYRVFDLDALGVVGDFDIEQVQVGVQEAASPGATQPLSVRLHTLEGNFQLANLSPLGGVDLDVPNQALTLLDVPIAATAPAGSVLVVEVFTPSGVDGGHSFWVGVNDDGQTGPTYLSAPECGVNEPTDVAALAIDGIDTTLIHLVLSVTGTAAP